jgi:hypothetical protein
MISVGRENALGCGIGDGRDVSSPRPIATAAAPTRARLVHILCAILLLGGCGGSPAPPATAAAQEPAVLQVADITIRASAVPTTVLGEATAKQYGIERDPRTVLLLVGVRRGSESQETSLPARVRGSAVDLLGRRQQFELREIRSDGFIDYAGSVQISPPETLRFDLVIERDGAAPAALSFNRDFFP